MADRLRELGFANVVPFHECETRTLGPGVRVTRYPAAGIENALYFKASSWTVLNYNDCNLPAAALRALIRRLGPVGLLLANYNHPPQLRHPLDRARVKRELASELLAKVRLIQPHFTIPFASEHYFRSPYARDRNECLLMPAELRALADGESRLLPLAVGDVVTFDRTWRPVVRRSASRVTPAAPDEKEYGPSMPWSMLQQVADSYCARVKNGFLGLVGWARPLRIRVVDLRRTLVLEVGRGAREGDALDERPHIQAHSTALYSWLGRRFGDDSFFAGGDFGVVSSDVRPLRQVMLAGMLEGSLLSPRDLLRMLRSPEDRAFLLRRRDEMWATLVGRRFRASESRL